MVASVENMSEVRPPEGVKEVVFLALGISNAGQRLNLEIPAYPWGKELAKLIREKVKNINEGIFPLVGRLQTEKENFCQNLSQLDQELWNLGLQSPVEAKLLEGDLCLLFLNLLKRETPLEVFLATAYFVSEREDVDCLFRGVKVAEIDKVSGKINLIWKNEDQEISLFPLGSTQRRVIKIS